MFKGEYITLYHGTDLVTAENVLSHRTFIVGEIQKKRPYLSGIMTDSREEAQYWANLHKESTGQVIVYQAPKKLVVDLFTYEGNPAKGIYGPIKYYRPSDKYKTLIRNLPQEYVKRRGGDISYFEWLATQGYEYYSIPSDWAKSLL